MDVDVAEIRIQTSRLRFLHWLMPRVLRYPREGFPWIKSYWWGESKSIRLNKLEWPPAGPDGTPDDMPFYLNWRGVLDPPGPQQLYPVRDPVGWPIRLTVHYMSKEALEIRAECYNEVFSPFFRDLIYEIVDHWDGIVPLRATISWPLPESAAETAPADPAETSRQSAGVGEAQFRETSEMIQEVCSKLRQELGRKPSKEKVAEELGISEDTLERRLKHYRLPWRLL